jgi:hypothetical protein
MTLAEALDIVIERTRHERYRFLVSEDNPDLEQREAYRAHVFQLAGSDPPPATSQPQRPEVATVFARLAKARACEFRVGPESGCGCLWGKCRDRGNAEISQADCLACSKTDKE